MVVRILQDKIKSTTKSLLLLGPRQTGKSTLLKGLSPDLTINLADEKTYLRFTADAGLLNEMIDAQSPTLIFIDEVQRIPSLLNTIQVILDDHPESFRFLLSGSSARKLKRGEANLLPGRLITFEMSPLLTEEIGQNFKIAQALSTGTLPGIWFSQSPKDRQWVLDSYAATYLKEEIQAEALTKDIPGFSRFLFMAARFAAQFIDYTKIASLAQIERKTCMRYFDILEDTLVAHRLEPFTDVRKAQLVAHPKFYFFDNGVLNALNGNFTVSADRKGVLFEQFVFQQILGLIKATRSNARIFYYRTKHGSEVDFIIKLQDQIFAVEVKATHTVGQQDLRGLNKFSEQAKCESHLLYAGEHLHKIGDVKIWPVTKFFTHFKKILDSYRYE